MVLSDNEIKQLLPALDFATDSTERQFSVEEQVQPCSIDLTLSNVFWFARGKEMVDLSRPQLEQIAPRHNWRRVDLSPGESIIIKPGRLLLGRTSEAFSIPAGYVGHLLGRSSFSRLGLVIQCSDGLINPGWRGHMPLQLLNLSRSSIRLVPFIPICQLQISKLSSPSSRVYGHKELQSKYMDDDGGPSYWWRDKRIKQLQERLQSINVPENIRTRIIETIGTFEPSVVRRFSHDLDNMQLTELQNSDLLLQKFAKREDDRRFSANMIRGSLIALFPLFVGACVNAAFSNSKVFSSHWYWLLGAVSLLVTLLAKRHALGDYFGAHELRQRRAEIGKRIGAIDKTEESS